MINDIVSHVRLAGVGSGCWSGWHSTCSSWRSLRSAAKQS